MGKMNKHEGALERMPWNGADSHEWGDHLSRYTYALRFIRGKTVLDAACGEGYGSEIIAKGGAKSVVGVDISREAIDIALGHFTGETARFYQGNVCNIEFADQSFDVVVSFETIEHVPDYERMLLEFKRVLKKDGVLIISTPNRLVISPNMELPINPFHVKEFSPSEFKNELCQYFSDVEVLAQKIVREKRGSWVRLIPQNFKKGLFGRLPYRAKGFIYLLIKGSHLRPTKEEFVFDNADLDKAWALLGICKK